jgi:hypothetical protein
VNAGVGHREPTCSAHIHPSRQEMMGAALRQVVQATSAEEARRVCRQAIVRLGRPLRSWRACSPTREIGRRSDVVRIRASVFSRVT